MLYIQHRVNGLEAVKALAPQYGAEIDLRSDRSGRLYLNHDPFSDGTSFDDWLAAYGGVPHQGPLILNTKEDGLEEVAQQACAKHGVTDYFFLDTAFPTLVKWALRGDERRFAVRVSAYETAAAALRFRGRADWAWVDCFDGNPMSKQDLDPLLGAFKLCLVSPEMQGQPVERISEFASLFAIADAVCSKRPDFWKAAHGR